MMKKILPPIVGIGFAIYGLHCVWNLHYYLGSNNYWNNPWRYKAYAALAATFICWLFSPSQSKRDTK